MPRAKSFDEEETLDHAMRLFWERGYEGTSLADLETHLGLGRQSLYNAFGDKQSLFLKVLARYQEMVSLDRLASLKAPDAGLGAIRAFFEASIADLTAPGPKRACLVANTILERGPQDPAALSCCNHARAELEGSLRGALAYAKGAREVSKRLDVAATATLLVSQLYGLGVLAKAGATAEELRAAVEVLLAGLR
jgi:TetR/AcrR family transcriptional repressor of nem operon